jgi:orotidine-5'-phosphate decarboxylase
MLRCRYKERMTTNPLLCAIDTADLARATALAAAVRNAVGGIKLGLEFFAAHGPAGVRQVVDGRLALFLDLKLHDIPNTVAGAVRSAAALEPTLLTVHAAGGPAMMEAARNAADLMASQGKRRIKLLGVTVLTSLDDGDLSAVGQQGPVGEQVRRLALLARDSGLDGVVCAPLEVAALREACGPDFLLVVPGIRPAGAASGDQKRVMGPRAAMQAGADYLVVGRPITDTPHPAAAAQAILDELR